MINADPLDVFRKIHARLTGINVNWCVTGSLGFALQGVPVEIHDIDIQTDTAAPILCKYGAPVSKEAPPMNRIRWQDRIVITPDLHHGDACIRGTRVPVATIVGSLADGLSYDEIRQAYPQLNVDDIRAALAYAAEALRSNVLVPLGSAV